MNATRIVYPFFSNILQIDFGWQNIAFASRLAVAAIAALAIAYWLELQDPQWAIVTVYILAQPITGAALAKGMYRVIGTVAGGLVGLIIIALFSQMPVPLIGSIALALGVCFYIGAQMRNFTAYGFLIAGYTTALVGLEGAFNPTGAWQIALDRIAEIIIGIVCVTTVSLLFFPRYAGVVLREQLATLFQRLCRYGAVALRPATPLATFADLRREMVAGVVTFDALRSYTVFEAPDMRADDGVLRLIVQEFLSVLAIARGLYMRIEKFQSEDARPVADRIKPVMEKTSAILDDIADGIEMRSDPDHVNSQLHVARAAVDAATADLEAMAGKVPFEPLADGLLILNRTGNLLHDLSTVVVSATTPTRRQSIQLKETAAPQENSMHTEALLQAIRCALVLVLTCIFWAATEWTEGFSAFVGVIIILFIAVNQDRPGKLGFTFLLWSAAGFFLAYLAMVFIFPRIEGYQMLALCLFVLLLPAGLMAGTSQYALPGLAFGLFLSSELGTGNVFQPDELAFFNSVLAQLLGMAICVVLLNLFPVNSLKSRGRSWALALGRLLPQAARGERSGRNIFTQIVAMLAGLLPRLALSRASEEDFLRGMLGTASTALELGRLSELKRDPALPQDAKSIISIFLDKFADAYGSLPQSGASLTTRLADAEANARTAFVALASLPLMSGSPAATLVLQAGASLRFIVDRFDIDKPFLDRSFDEGME